jgi:hypothetical protein
MSRAPLCFKYGFLYSTYSPHRVLALSSWLFCGGEDVDLPVTVTPSSLPCNKQTRLAPVDVKLHIVQPNFISFHTFISVTHV